MNETGFDAVTPELALVDPELAEAQRQTIEGKAAMSTTEPSNGTFFIDPAQPAPAPLAHEPSPAPAPAPLPEPVPVPAAAVAAPASPSAPALGDTAGAPMVDVPLGTLIFRAGLLAEEQLEDALQEGMRTGKRLGEVLLERGWLHERDLGRLLAGQKGLPFVEVSAADCDPAALQVIPEEKARLQVTLPLRYEDGQLAVAVADPSNELVIENLRRTIGSEPKLVVAPHTELVRVIEEAYAGARNAAEPSLVAPEPVIAEVPPAAPEPVPAPEPAVAPQPALIETPELEAQPQTAPPPLLVPSLHVEPEQPVATPEALPTVLPPAEERSAAHAEVPPLQPLVMEPAPQVVEPLADAPTAPAFEETPAPLPVEEAPAPLLEQPVATQPEPAPQAAPLLQPAEPAPEPAPVALPVEGGEPPQPAPEPVPEPAPLVSSPAEPPFAPAAATPPPSPEPEPAPLTPAEPAPAIEPPAELHAGTDALHVVVLRLRDGDVLEVGTFGTAPEAADRAKEVVRQIATAEGEASWPFFAERYLRPDTIVSVDLLDNPADKWMGSAVRSRWAKQGDE